MKLNPGIRARLILLVLLAVLPALALLLYRAREDRRRVARDAQETSLRLARNAATSQSQLVDGVWQMITGVAQAPVLRSGDIPAIQTFLANLLRQYRRYSNFAFVAPDGNVLASAVPMTGAANVADRLVIARAMSKRGFAIGEYAIGAVSKRPQIEFATPVINKDDKLVAILYAAIDLAWMQEFISKQQLPPGGFVTLVDQHGTVLARSKDVDRWIGKSLKDLPLYRSINGRSEGVERLPDMAGVDHLYAFASTRSDRDGGEGYIWVGMPASLAFAEVNRTEVRDLIILSTVAALTLLLAWFGGRALIVRRLEKLVVAADRVASGDLNASADDSSSDEIGHLASVFNAMVPRLKSHMDLQQALAMAMQVQQALLPAGDPTDDRLDIAGRSRYCDATGGDYYDFLDISHTPEKAALIAVGDVSGHGIAAALLMASARAALRAGAADAGQLSKLMMRVNRVLAADNRHNRFMTMALLLIDPERGNVRWASAGHDPAIVFHPTDDRFDDLDGGDIPLGIDAATVYEEYQSNGLRRGDLLFVGTDGIWEMRNSAGEMFGKERLRDVIRAHRGESAKQIAAAIEAKLNDYRGEAHQEDDVTFVLIRVK